MLKTDDLINSLTQFFRLVWGTQAFILPRQSSKQPLHLPHQLAIAILCICLLPITLNLMGVDFGTYALQLDLETLPDLTSHQLTDTLHQNPAVLLIHS